MDLRFREISGVDFSILSEFLHLAIFVPPGQVSFEKSIIDLPEISRYIEDWNDSKDFGIICFANEKPIGAIWGRLFTAQDKGYGFVDAQTPELTMAIKETYRNRGIGNWLMQQFCQQIKNRGFNSISLSVDKRNRAFGFYKRMGFFVVGEMETSFTMKIKL